MKKGKIFLTLLFSIIIVSTSSTSAFNFPSSSSTITSSFYTGNLTNLSEMMDVNIPTPSDSDFLRFLGATNKWVAYTFNLADYWDYDYADLINEPTTLSQFTDNLGNRGYTSVSNFTNDFGFYNSTTLPDLNSSGLIKDWNSTGYIKDWNASGLIQNWTVDTNTFYLTSNPFGFYNSTTIPAYLLTETDPLWTANQSSYSTTSQANALYYALSNPYGYYNFTTLPSLPETDPHWTGNYSTYLTLFNWNKTYADSLYYGISNPNAYYNSTTLPDLNSTGLIKDWNATGFIKDWNSTGFITNQTQDLSGYYLNTNPYIFWNETFALFNKTYADSLYYPSNNPYAFYNSSNPPPIVNDSYYLASNPFSFYNSTTLPDLNASGLIIDWNATGYIKDWNSTGLIINWSIDTSSFLTIETDPHWTGNYSTYLTLFNWNKTYADALYYPYSTNPLSFWNSTFATFNKTYADTLYAPINYGDDWNKTYADTLYKDIGVETWNSTASGFNKTYADTLYKDIGITTWNETHSDFNKTYADTLYYDGVLNNLAFWNSTFALFNKTYADTLYYDKSANTLGYWNSTFALFNKTYADTLYLTSYTETDPLWTANQSSYSTTASANLLYKPIGIETWNSTFSAINKTYTDTLYAGITEPVALSLGNWSADKSSYSTTSQANALYYPISSNPLGYYNSTNPSPVVNTSYYLVTNPFGFYNSTSLTTNTQLLNGNNYWNTTFAGFNETYANTKYKPIGITTWNGTHADINKTYTDTLYYGKSNNALAFWNSTFATFNKTYADALYYPYSTNPLSFWNSTFATFNKTYADTLYGTKAEPLWTANQSSYSTTVQANALYKAIGITTWNGTHADFNKTYGDTLYYPLNTNSRNYWNSTWAGFNKTYADTLYQASGSYLTVESDPHWTGNQSSYATLAVLNNGTYANVPETDPKWTGNSTLVPYLASTNTFTNNNLINGNFTVGSNWFFVNNNTGNIGIGTNNPERKLVISGITEQLQLEYDATKFARFNVRNNGDLSIYAYGGGEYRNILLGVYGETAGGKVGVGTATPQNTLNVVGDLNVTTTSNFGGNVTMNDCIVFSNGGTMCSA